MNQNNSASNRVILIIFGSLLIVLLVSSAFFYTKITSISKEMSGLGVGKQDNQILPDNNSQISQQQKDEIARECASIVSTKTNSGPTIEQTPQPTAKLTQTSTPTPLKQISYIPLSGPITTTSTGWVDAPGTDIYIDLAADYNQQALLTWEAYLSVANSNGQAFARIYDVTHSIAVNGSEVSITNNNIPTRISSSNLSLWQGRNLYQVQLKSLNSFEITFTSGRIKIVY